MASGRWRAPRRHGENDCTNVLDRSLRLVHDRLLDDRRGARRLDRTFVRYEVDSIRSDKTV